MMHLFHVPSLRGHHFVCCFPPHTHPGSTTCPPLRLGDKVNALLTKRMSTLRKDLVHVSELMRDSIIHMQDITPASALAARTSDAATAPPAAMASGGGKAPPVVAVAAANGPVGHPLAPSPTPPRVVVSAHDVQLQERPAEGTSTSSVLLSAVTSALAEPVPPGAYVVRDVKISHLAGELDAFTQG